MRQQYFRRPLTRYALVWALALAATSSASGQNPAYTTIDFPGAIGSSAWGINPQGDVVGVYFFADTIRHGFLQRGGRFTSIDFPGISGTQAFGINDRGDIVGDYTRDGVVRGFILSDGRFTSIDVPGAASTDPAAINSRGDVVGIFTLPDKSGHGFLYSGNRFTRLDCPNATSTTGNGLNSLGEIVGNCTVGGITHAFLRSNGKFTLIDYPGAAFTGAYGIDALGNIVGRYRDAAGVNHGYLLSGGKFTTYDVPTATFTMLAAINSAGDTVGRYTINSVTHGLLFPSPHDSYSLTDLGKLPGGSFSQPSFLADNGLVAGVADVAGGAQHSVLWQFGKIIDIGTVGFGGPNNGVYGINARGQASGIGESAAKDPYGEDFCGYGTHLKCLPFRWQNGIMTPLPLLGGNNGTIGNINQRGEIVGVAENNLQDKAWPAPQVLDFQAVVWGPGRGQIRPLSPLTGDTVSVAFWINELGQAVGASGTCANTMLPPVAFGPRAVLWEADGTPTDLGNLGGTGDPALNTGNMALAVNNREQVVGASVLLGNAITHAFLWTRETGMRDLGTLRGDVNSAGLAINDLGEVVGISYGPRGPFDGSGHPFVWRNGMMTELKTLIPADAPLSMAFAGGLNNRGEIAGFGRTAQGDFHGVVLTPNRDGTGAASNAAVVTQPEDAGATLQPPVAFGRFGARPPR